MDNNFEEQKSPVIQVEIPNTKPVTGEGDIEDAVHQFLQQQQNLSFNDQYEFTGAFSRRVQQPDFDHSFIADFRPKNTEPTHDGSQPDSAIYSPLMMADPSSDSIAARVSQLPLQQQPGSPSTAYQTPQLFSQKIQNNFQSPLHQHQQFGHQQEQHHQVQNHPLQQQTHQQQNLQQQALQQQHQLQQFDQRPLHHQHLQDQRAFNQQQQVDQQLPFLHSSWQQPLAPDAYPPLQESSTQQEPIVQAQVNIFGVSSSEQDLSAYQSAHQSSTMHQSAYQSAFDSAHQSAHQQSIQQQQQQQVGSASGTAGAPTIPVGNGGPTGPGGPMGARLGGNGRSSEVSGVDGEENDCSNPDNVHIQPLSLKQYNEVEFSLQDFKKMTDSVKEFGDHPMTTVLQPTSNNHLDKLVMSRNTHLKGVQDNDNQMIPQQKENMVQTQDLPGLWSGSSQLQDDDKFIQTNTGQVLSGGGESLDPTIQLGGTQSSQMNSFLSPTAHLIQQMQQLRKRSQNRIKTQPSKQKRQKKSTTTRNNTNDFLNMPLAEISRSQNVPTPVPPPEESLPPPVRSRSQKPIQTEVTNIIIQPDTPTTNRQSRRSMSTKYLRTDENVKSYFQKDRKANQANLKKLSVEKKKMESQLNEAQAIVNQYKDQLEKEKQQALNLKVQNREISQQLNDNLTKESMIPFDRKRVTDTIQELQLSFNDLLASDAAGSLAAVSLTSSGGLSYSNGGVCSSKNPSVVKEWIQNLSGGIQSLNHLLQELSVQSYYEDQGTVELPLSKLKEAEAVIQTQNDLNTAFLRNQVVWERTVVYGMKNELAITQDRYEALRNEEASKHQVLNEQANESIQKYQATIDNMKERFSELTKSLLEIEKAKDKQLKKAKAEMKQKIKEATTWKKSELKQAIKAKDLAISELQKAIKLLESGDQVNTGLKADLESAQQQVQEMQAFMKKQDEFMKEQQDKIVKLSHQLNKVMRKAYASKKDDTDQLQQPQQLQREPQQQQWQNSQPTPHQQQPLPQQSQNLHSQHLPGSSQHTGSEQLPVSQQHPSEYQLAPSQSTQQPLSQEQQDMLSDRLLNEQSPYIIQERSSSGIHSLYDQHQRALSQLVSANSNALTLQQMSQRNHQESDAVPANRDTGVIGISSDDQSLIRESNPSMPQPTHDRQIQYNQQYQHNLPTAPPTKPLESAQLSSSKNPSSPSTPIEWQQQQHPLSIFYNKQGEEPKQQHNRYKSVFSGASELSTFTNQLNKVTGVKPSDFAQFVTSPSNMPQEESIEEAPEISQEYHMNSTQLDCNKNVSILKSQMSQMDNSTISHLDQYQQPTTEASKTPLQIEPHHQVMSRQLTQTKTTPKFEQSRYFPQGRFSGTKPGRSPGKSPNGAKTTGPSRLGGRLARRSPGRTSNSRSASGAGQRYAQGNLMGRPLGQSTGYNPSGFVPLRRSPASRAAAVVQTAAKRSGSKGTRKISGSRIKSGERVIDNQVQHSEEDARHNRKPHQEVVCCQCKLKMNNESAIESSFLDSAAQPLNADNQANDFNSMLNFYQNLNSSYLQQPQQPNKGVVSFSDTINTSMIPSQNNMNQSFNDFDLGAK